MLDILEVTIGLALVFAFVSLIASMIAEWLAGFLAMRGKMLWQGVSDLVGEELGNKVHKHPLVEGLKHKTWFHSVSKTLRLQTVWPSYVPTETFVLGLLSSLDEPAGLPTDFDSLRAAVEKVQEPKAKRALLTLVDDAGGDFVQAKARIGSWFDASMDEVSGWYKRWSQTMLLWIALLVSFVMGVDSLQIGEELWRDEETRAALVGAANDFLDQQRPELASALEAAAPSPAAGGSQGIGAEPNAAPPAGEVEETSGSYQTRAELQELSAELNQLDLPLEPLSEALRERPEENRARVAWDWLCAHILGFLLTGLAASLGAPFWFDVLNRFINLRSGFKSLTSAASGGPSAASGRRTAQT